MSEIKLPTEVHPIGPVHVKLSRQRIRHIGQAEHYFRVNQMLSHRSQPVLSRKERRRAARDANKRAWQDRDKELIAKYQAGFTPEETKDHGEISRQCDQAPRPDDQRSGAGGNESARLRGEAVPLFGSVAESGGEPGAPLR